jgi:hypothetical protein
MTTSRRKRIIWANQTLRRSEKRIYSAIIALIAPLAREIEQNTSSMTADRIDRWERDTSIALFPVAVETATLFADQTLYYFELKSLKSFIADTIRRWASVFAPARAAILANELRKAVNKLTVDVGSNPAATLKSTLIAKSTITRIARDFAHEASEQGSYIAASRVGVPMMKEWAAMEDDRVRPNHAFANRQLRPINVPFLVGSSNMMYPGDLTAPISERANCRCTALYYPIINGVLIR